MTTGFTTTNWTRIALYNLPPAPKPLGGTIPRPKLVKVTPTVTATKATAARVAKFAAWAKTGRVAA